MSTTTDKQRILLDAGIPEPTMNRVLALKPDRAKPSSSPSDRDPWLPYWVRLFLIETGHYGYSNAATYRESLRAMASDIATYETDVSPGLSLMIQDIGSRLDFDRQKLEEIPVNPRHILMAIALCLLHKSLTQGFFADDLAWLDILISIYNDLPGIPYRLTRGSLFVISMTPFFRNQALFTRMYPKLAHIPGVSGDYAAGFALSLATFHRNAPYNDELDDFYAYPPLLIRATQALRGSTSKGARRVAVSGMKQFADFMVRYMLGWEQKEVRRISDETDEERAATRHELDGLKYEIAHWLYAIWDDIERGVAHVLARQTSIANIHPLRRDDPFWSGLHMVLLSALEEKIRQPLDVTLIQLFFSFKARNAAVVALFDGLRRLSYEKDDHRLYYKRPVGGPTLGHFKIILDHQA